MTTRPCLTCGALTPNSYCPTHLPRNGSTRTWRQTRQLILQRDGHQCTWTANGARCPNPAAHVDHILAIHANGTDHPTNLRSLCADCHTLRHHPRKKAA